MAVKIICNRCGKEFDVYDEESGLVHTDTLGYGSKFDGDEIDLALCCDCLDEILEYADNKWAVSPFK